MMPQVPFQSRPIDMAGFRFLRVEACLSGNSAERTGPVTLHVLGTRSGDDEKKAWVGKGSDLVVYPGEVTTAVFTDIGRLARIDGGPGTCMGEGALRIQILRMK